MIHCLRDSASSVRQAAADALGKMNADTQMSMLGELTQMFDDPCEKCRNAVVGVVGRLQSAVQRAASRRWAELLRHQDHIRMSVPSRETAMRAMQCLTLAGNSDVADVVRAALSSNVLSVRRLAADMYLSLPQDTQKELAEDVTWLLCLTGSGSREVRQTATAVVGSMSEDVQLACMHAVVSLMNKSKPEIQDAAVAAVSHMQRNVQEVAGKAISELLLSTEAKYAKTRMTALRAIGWAGKNKHAGL